MVLTFERQKTNLGFEVRTENIHKGVRSPNRWNFRCSIGVKPFRRFYDGKAYEGIISSIILDSTTVAAFYGRFEQVHIFRSVTDVGEASRKFRRFGLTSRKRGGGRNQRSVYCIVRYNINPE